MRMALLTVRKQDVPLLPRGEQSVDLLPVSEQDVALLPGGEQVAEVDHDDIARELGVSSACRANFVMINKGKRFFSRLREAVPRRGAFPIPTAGIFAASRPLSN